MAAAAVVLTVEKAAPTLVASGNDGHAECGPRGGASRSNGGGEVSETVVRKWLDVAQENPAVVASLSCRLDYSGEGRDIFSSSQLRAAPGYGRWRRSSPCSGGTVGLGSVGLPLLTWAQEQAGAPTSRQEREAMVGRVRCVVVEKGICVLTVSSRKAD
uniref:Uncharacterized protein n=1 Tax=Oryza nivara TaxID=4536 RepID=A0A0E0GYK8_ORYNI